MKQSTKSKQIQQTMTKAAIPAIAEEGSESSHHLSPSNSTTTLTTHLVDTGAMHSGTHNDNDNSSLPAAATSHDHSSSSSLSLEQEKAQRIMDLSSRRRKRAEEAQQQQQQEMNSSGRSVRWGDEIHTMDNSQDNNDDNNNGNSSTDSDLEERDLEMADVADHWMRTNGDDQQLVSLPLKKEHYVQTQEEGDNEEGDADDIDDEDYNYYYDLSDVVINDRKATDLEDDEKSNDTNDKNEKDPPSEDFSYVSCSDSNASSYSSTEALESAIAMGIFGVYFQHIKDDLWQWFLNTFMPFAEKAFNFIMKLFKKCRGNDDDNGPDADDLMGDVADAAGPDGLNPLLHGAPAPTGAPPGAGGGGSGPPPAQAQMAQAAANNAASAGAAGGAAAAAAAAAAGGMAAGLAAQVGVAVGVGKTCTVLVQG